MVFYGWEPLILSQHRAKFGGHRYCGSEDIIILVPEKEDSKCSTFNPPLVFIPKGHELKARSISY